MEWGPNREDSSLLCQLLACLSLSLQKKLEENCDDMVDLFECVMGKVENFSNFLGVSIECFEDQTKRLLHAIEDHQKTVVRMGTPNNKAMVAKGSRE